ncbi:hypothetical protein [Natronoarchaeum rubrum]|uniref:hypothetical protein n=1 Tax=Natronoarchaeum rubrum TaxID=755311 RepID=UPI0021137CD2|nr:hypothetical protein [Natronoarchaeum rubrum]
MTDLSRRRVLLTGGGLAITALAGCTGDESNDGDENEPMDGGNETDDPAANETGDSAANETDGETETDAAQEPYDNGDVHKHGQLYLELDGESIALGTEEENWEQNGADEHFYFTEGDSTTWHLRSRGVTLEYALNAIPTLEATADSLTYDGTTYEDGDDASVSFRVNGESVDFEQYALEHGDEIRITVDTDGSDATTDEGSIDGGNTTDLNTSDGNESQTDSSF